MRSLIISLVVCFQFPFVFSIAGEPGSELEFLELSSFNKKDSAKWSAVVKDIVNHEAPGDYNPYQDLVTLTHETSHGIHAWIRNNMNETGEKINGFYVLEDRAVIVKEPRMRKSQVAPFVPRSLRGSRFSTYITGQTAWDDTPLYIWDEWVAYVNGGDSAVDLVQKGLWHYGWRDAVAGQIEFVVYAIATAMAVQKHDPDYFNNYRQFREFLAWNLERSMKSFELGAQMEFFKWDKQDRYYESLLTSADATELRRFVIKMYGAQWAQSVLGIEQIDGRSLFLQRKVALLSLFSLE